MRAGSRQVIDVVAIVIENAFRPANGRLSRQENSLSPTCQVFNDLPKSLLHSDPFLRSMVV